MESQDVNIADAVRITGMAVHLVPEHLLQVLEQIVPLSDGGKRTPEDAEVHPVTLLAQIGEVNAIIGGTHHAVVPTQTVTLWHMQQLAILYVSINRLFDHPEASDAMRQSWRRHLDEAAQHTDQQDRPRVAALVSDAPAVTPASTRSDEIHRFPGGQHEPRGGQYL